MNTNKKRKVALGTTNKSIDARQPKWFRRKVRQVWDGGLGRRIMYFETAAWLILIPKLQQLAMNPWRAPQNIALADAPDQVLDICRDWRPSPATLPRFPGPECPKAQAVPSNDGLRLDDHYPVKTAGP